MRAKVGAVAPWAGGKVRLAPQIAGLLGEHRIYAEPFCGGCSVLLAKPRAPLEYLNDLHGDLVNMILMMQERPEAFERSLRPAVWCEHQFELALEMLAEKGYTSDNPPEAEPGQVIYEHPFDYALRLELAVAAFRVWWMGAAGRAGMPLGSMSPALRFTTGGGTGARRYLSAVESIAAMGARLEGVHVTRRDALELLGRLPDTDETAIYVDPPYALEGSLYAHHGTTPQQLAAVLGRFEQARIVVSYYEDPQVFEAFEGWDFQRVEVGKPLAQVKAGERNGARAVELLISKRCDRPRKTGGSA